MVSQAASRRNVTIVIAATDVATALNRLHDRFFDDVARGPEGPRQHAAGAAVSR